jgi:hypothetical protein
VQLGVIGGSCSTNIFLPPDFAPWPERLVNFHPEITETTLRQQGMLTISRALPLAAELPNQDVILLTFAATMAWPVVNRGVSQFLAPYMQHETSFHLAPYRSRSVKRRMVKGAKRFTLNVVKYLAFPFGLYRPTNSLRDLDDQVRALLSIAKSKSQKVVWVQHQPMRDSRIWLERLMFDRYYARLVSTLREQAVPNFQLIEFPPEFMIQENFLADEVHLSRLGHERLAAYLVEQGALEMCE